MKMTAQSLALLSAMSWSVLCTSAAMEVDPGVVAAIRGELRSNDLVGEGRARRMEAIAVAALDPIEELGADKSKNIGWQLRAYLMARTDVAAGRDDLADAQFDWAMRAFGSLRSINAIDRAAAQQLHRAMREAVRRHVARQGGLSEANRAALSNAVAARLDGDEPQVGNYFFPTRLYVSPGCVTPGADVIEAMLERLDAEESLRSVGPGRIAQLSSAESMVAADAVKGRPTGAAEARVERAFDAIVDTWVAAAHQALASCFLLPQPADGLPSHAALSAERSAQRRAEAVRIAAEAAFDPTTGEQAPPGDEWRRSTAGPVPDERPAEPKPWSDAVRALLAEAGTRIQDGAVIVSGSR